MPWDLHRLSAFLVLAASASPALAADFPPEQIEFFEKKIRPVLVAKCGSCHIGSGANVKGGLHVDSRENLLTGGSSGASIVPGKPDESLLIQALRYEGYEMPPKTKLADEVIADFVKWVELGAPAPPAAAEALVTKDIDFEAARQHWAYQPRVAHPAPVVKRADWPLTSIDPFVLSKLEAADLPPAADVDKATWLRRVTFDLIGLPPTPEEWSEFAKDDSPEAFAKVVDGLLARKEFGEKWARHWLDVAHFAESTGKERNFIYHQAWRYRNYVVDAFNADKPYDRFLIEQIAGDLLPAENDAQRNEQTVATGFLAIGLKGINDRNRESYFLEIVDDQLDVVTRSTLATSVTCARCHDHKFDPIPTTDYYAMAGIFRSTAPLDGVKNRTRQSNDVNFLQPLSGVTTPEETARLKELGGLMIAAQKAWDDKRIEVQKLRREVRAKTALVATTTGTPTPAPAAGSNEGSSSPDASAAPAPAPEASGAPAASDAAKPDEAKPDETQAKKAAKKAKKNKKKADANAVDATETAETVTPAAAAADKASTNAVVATPTNADAASAASEQPKAAAPSTEPAKPLTIEEELAAQEKLLRELDDKATALAEEAATLTLKSTAVAVADRETPTDLAVRIRGETDRIGPTVKRGLLTVLAHLPAPEMPGDHSGRLELAKWIGSDQNPLTARVAVNRIWSKIFGTGLVATVDDFGSQGEKPSHPELLDQLAVDFVRNNWSVKQLVREVVLSRTYRQSGAGDVRGDDVDGENRLLWKFPRRRLDSEAIRDAILVVSGDLDATRPEGSVVSELGYRELNGNAKLDALHRPSRHRTIYLPVVRGHVPEMLAIFDQPDPSLLVGKRDVTTGPAQALYLLNSPFALDQAEKFAQRVRETTADDVGRIDAAYRLALGREPSTAERERIISHLADYRASLKLDDPAAADLAAWTSVAQALLASPEFRYVF